MNISSQDITDKQVWESFIQIYSPHALFQSWLWGEVQQAEGQSIERIGFYKNQSLIAIAQIACIEARRGRFLHIRHGPIVSSKVKTDWEEITHLLKEKAKKKQVLFVRMSPLMSDSQNSHILMLSLEAISAPIHAMDGELCWVLDLSSSEEELLVHMRKSTRYDIRQAEKYGIDIRSSGNPKDLWDFFTLYNATSLRHGFVQHTGIKNEFELFAKEKKAILYRAYVQKELTAAAIILYHNGQAIYHHGASVSSRAPATTVLQWQSIRDAKAQGIVKYNFWGVAPEDKPNHPWRGISLFKRGFGGHEERYLHAHDIPVSPLYIFPYSVETFRRWQKGY